MIGQPWQVETQCPQCGAPVVMEEAQHVLRCDYCKSRLYLLSKGPFRYLIPPRFQETDALFVPFWRVRGLGFTAYTPPKIDGRPIDKTLSAVNLPIETYSLGFRPQTMRLKFAQPHKDWGFLRPQRNLQSLLKGVIRQLSEPETERERVKVHRYSHGVESSDSLDRDALFFPPAYRTVVKHYHPILTAFLDEGVSLIYYPVMAGMGIDSVTLSDGLTNRPIGHAEPEEWEGLERRAVTKPSPPIEALPLLCPNCGWDLECQEKSRVALCPGCTKALSVRGGGYVEVPFRTMTTDDPDAIHLPFWRIEAEIPRLELRTVEDLMRFANRTQPPEHPEDPLSFYLPAFAVQPRFFLQLSQVFTLNQPINNFSESMPKRPHPITLTWEKVSKLIPMVVAELCANKDELFPELPLIEPKIKRTSLIFMPFRNMGYQALFQEGFTYAVPSGALRWGKRL